MWPQKLIFGDFDFFVGTENKRVKMAKNWQKLMSFMQINFLIFCGYNK